MVENTRPKQNSDSLSQHSEKLHSQSHSILRMSSSIKLKSSFPLFLHILITFTLRRKLKSKELIFLIDLLPRNLATHPRHSNTTNLTNLMLPHSWLSPTVLKSQIKKRHLDEELLKVYIMVRYLFRWSLNSGDIQNTAKFWRMQMKTNCEVTSDIQ